jgi:hypothetical protein
VCIISKKNGIHPILQSTLLTGTRVRSEKFYGNYKSHRWRRYGSGGHAITFYQHDRENLCRKKVISDSSCPICELEVESIFHLLWQCPSAQNVWSGGCVEFQKSSLGGTDFLQAAEEMLNKSSIGEFQSFIMIARRNMYLYESSFSHPIYILKIAETALKDFHQARAGVKN